MRENRLPSGVRDIFGDEYVNSILPVKAREPGVPEISPSGGLRQAR